MSSSAHANNTTRLKAGPYIKYCLVHDADRDVGIVRVDVVVDINIVLSQTVVLHARNNSLQQVVLVCRFVPNSRLWEKRLVLVHAVNLAEQEVGVLS